MTMESGQLAVADDAPLLHALALGDDGAFRLLYRRHTPRLKGLLHRMLGGDAADTDDALQEAWIRAVASLDRYRGDAPFATWLGGIGVRVAWELIRKRRPWVEFSAGDAPAVEVVSPHERIDLEAALARLPEPHRVVVVLHDVEGFTHEEIAAALGVATATSRSHLFRGRRALRCLLQSYERVLE